MRVNFDGKEYFKRGRNGKALKDLCFDIFKRYIRENISLDYKVIQTIFNEWHCNNRKVLLTEDEWEAQTYDGKNRYFSPIEHNGVKLYFTTQWGNNGGECDNINKIIEFAKEQGYSISIIEQNVQKNTQEKNMGQNTKNIILYGPPGVGKTYNHKKLISLIESGVDQKEIFDAIKNGNLDSDEAMFEEVKNDGRFKFVTFHQSYSYEDFIEGFRPNEDGKIELKDGIFKEIVEIARENLLRSQKRNEIFFKDALNLLLKDKIENEESVKIDLKRSGSYYKIYDYNDRTIFFEKQNGDKTHSLSIKTLKRMYEDGENNIIHGGLSPYYNPLLGELLKIKHQNTIDEVEQKNYYLLIDEINRGNISKIFGELITLIEEDKRDDIEVTLPYSKDLFKIPSNLYIIATMNSTDKSIALIDIALRRRFTFLKIKPYSNLIKDPIAKEIFIALNEKIGSTLGEDYLIGHSYFMGDNLDLEFVLKYKIMPLMEEYFYSDNVGFAEIKEILQSF